VLAGVTGGPESRPEVVGQRRRCQRIQDSTLLGGGKDLGQWRCHGAFPWSVEMLSLDGEMLLLDRSVRTARRIHGDGLAVG
jgi:hypothetical protein